MKTRKKLYVKRQQPVFTIGSIWAVFVKRLKPNTKGVLTTLTKNV